MRRPRTQLGGPGPSLLGQGSVYAKDFTFVFAADLLSLGRSFTTCEAVLSLRVTDVRNVQA